MCTHPDELVELQETLDEEHETLHKKLTTSASVLATTSMRTVSWLLIYQMEKRVKGQYLGCDSNFPNEHHVYLDPICPGGWIRCTVPNEEAEIRVEDVIVSKPHGVYGERCSTNK